MPWLISHAKDIHTIWYRIVRLLLIPCRGEYPTSNASGISQLPCAHPWIRCGPVSWCSEKSSRGQDLAHLDPHVRGLILGLQDRWSRRYAP